MRFFFVLVVGLVSFFAGALAQVRALPMCRIEVTREGSGQNHQQELGASLRPSIVARDRNQVSQSSAVSSLVVSSGREASIQVDGEAIFVKCYALRGGFEIDLSVVSVDPKNKSSKRLTTSLSVQRGQRTEIGGVIRNLKEKNRTLSLGGIGFEKSSGASQERVYLVLN